ncbi:hypothetical protein DFH08DRAFT_882745 [Mycena albidolilacea]|uniref:Uncharacterized protein n=1 Tax=Mycena albidolilacea TaxID=1033008 RepID=A0AAD6ZP91_9AGAR|nr:hypothetical protein DFH08DRAFT_882745 [Mycena albidolilacea]
MILTLFLGWLGLGILRLDQILRGYHGLRKISSKTSFGRKYIGQDLELRAQRDRQDLSDKSHPTSAKHRITPHWWVDSV